MDVHREGGSYEDYDHQGANTNNSQGGRGRKGGGVGATLPVVIRGEGGGRAGGEGGKGGKGGDGGASQGGGRGAAQAETGRVV